MGGVSATIGTITLQRSNGRIYYIKMAADGTVLYAKNTGPTATAAYMVTGTIRVAPQTNEVFMCGGYELWA